MIINLILWLSFYIKFKKTFSPKKILENIASEVDKLLIEIDKTTDRDLSLLESKIQTLREVISYADKRILMAEKEESKRKMEQDVISKNIKQDLFLGFLHPPQIFQRHLLSPPQHLHNSMQRS